ncbi:unnamed protein product [Trichobilharzia szidati]|nr:unnamed protein product [Trichobilharzia szidati]
MEKVKSFVTKADFGSEIDSPLYCLKSILESPQVVPKGQFLSKLDEIRSLSSKLSEIQHLYEDNTCELNRLNSELKASEMKRREIEVRLKRREAELRELRDELTCEIEMRSRHEKRSNLVDDLQESLKDAREKLKSMDHVSKENEKLLEENSRLKAKQREFESYRQQASYQQELERQLSQMRVAAQLADNELHELLCQREELLARCEAEKLAKENSLIRNRGCVSGAPSGESCRVELRCFGMSPPSSPDSSQPGVDTRTEVPVSSDLGFGECLASVVMVDNQLKGLESDVLKAESEYQSMKKKFILQRFISLVLLAVVRHRGSVIDNSKQLTELLSNEMSRRNSQINGRLEKLSEQVSNAEVRLNDTKEVVSKMQKRQSELCGENRRLTGELGRIKEANEMALHKWENEVDCLMAENQKLSAEVTSLRCHLGDNKVKMDEDLKRIDEAASEVERLNLKLSDLERVYSESKAVNHNLRVQLSEQVNANKAFRSAAEEEIERLKNTLATSASEYESVVSIMTDEHRREKDKLLSDIKVAEDSKEMGLREAGRLKVLLEDTENELRNEKEKGIQASTLSRAFKNEVAELRCDLSKTRENLLEVEERLKSSNVLVDRLQATNKDLTVQLSATENSCSMKEKEICRLVTQIVELECENKRSSEKIGELECFVESATGVHKDLEHQCGVFRKQVSEMEAACLSTRQQLTETREQLIKTEELLHMHRLRLLRAEFERNELRTRLELIGRKSEVGRRSIRSNSDVGSGLSRVCCRGGVEAKPNQDSKSVCESLLNLVDKDVVLKEGEERSVVGDEMSTTNKAIKKRTCDVSVQICDPYIHMKCVHQTVCGDCCI